MALPGVSISILDRLYGSTRTDVPTGPRVALIAKRSTASGTDGVLDLDAYLAKNEDDVVTKFGSDSHIHRAFREALSAGIANIVLVPLPSDTTFTAATGVVTSSTYGGSVFDAAFDAVESAQADIVVPWGAGSNSTHWESPATPGNDGSFDYFYADNSTNVSYSWAKMVADKCATITSRSAPLFGVMGLKPYIGVSNSDSSVLASSLSTHLGYSSLVSKASLTNGHYLQIVSGEFRIKGQSSTWGYTNGAVLYAGLAATLDPFTATTNKFVYNVDRVRWNPTRTQADTLSTMGVVCASLDLNSSVRWIDGVTFATDSSDFARLTTLRIVFDAVKLVRAVSYNYIGEASSLNNRNAFETQITAGLRGMQISGALIESDFRVSYIANEGKAIIDLALRPAFELRVIEVTVAVDF